MKERKEIGRRGSCVVICCSQRGEPWPGRKGGTDNNWNMYCMVYQPNQIGYLCTAQGAHVWYSNECLPVSMSRISPFSTGLVADTGCSNFSLDRMSPPSRSWLPQQSMPNLEHWLPENNGAYY